MKSKHKHNHNILSNAAGFTLVEVMMTLLIFSVVLGVIGNVFFTTQGLYGRTTDRAGQQMSARAGLTVMTEELRRAGADPENTGLVGLVTCAQDTIRVRAELNDIPGIQTTEPSEDVIYFYDAPTMTLFRDSGAGPVAMMTNVTDFQLGYFDANNQVLVPLPLAANLADAVESVNISVTTNSNRGGYMTATTRVGFRNN